MHYKSFEWGLYIQGKPSQRMMDEMERHLESCDECMSVYVMALGENLESEKPIHVETYEKEKPQSRIRRLFQPRMRWASLAAAVLICLVFLGFTPKGKIVWAQIRTSLESFGGSLIGIFQLPSDSDYVQDVGLIQTAELPADPVSKESDSPGNEISAEGLEIKLDQVLVENDRFTYAILASGQALEGAERIHFFDNIEINGMNPLGMGTGSSEPFNEEGYVLMTYMTYQMQPGLFEKAETLPVKITLYSLEASSSLGSRRIEGPWVFEFEIANGAVTGDTRIILLDRTITVDQAVYTLDQLNINPLQPRLTVIRKRDQQLPALQNPKATLGKGNLIGFAIVTDDGSEIPFEVASVESKLDEAVITYAAEMQLDQTLIETKSLQIMPYISKRDWQVTRPGVLGYYPLAEQAFDIELNELQNHEGKK